MRTIKPVLLVLLSFVFITAILSWKESAGGTVRGNVIPVEGGLRAFLFSGKDTVSVNVVSGTFQFSNVAAGSYSLLVQAAPPYRNAVKDGIRVAEGEFTDAGQIELLKQ